MMDLYGLYRATDNTAYLNFILKNAASIQSGDRGSKNIIGLNWSDPSHYWSATEASTQASGIAVLNAGL